jgi:hypothetical protein
MGLWLTFFSRPKARIRGRGIVSCPMSKLTRERAVCAPYSLRRRPQSKGVSEEEIEREFLEEIWRER